MADIYLPKSMGVDGDGYPTWRTTLDHGYFTSREQIEAWINARDFPAAWDWEDCSPSPSPPAGAEAGAPRHELRRIVRAHVYDGGHGTLNDRQVERVVGDITAAVLDVFDLAPKGAY